MTALAIYLMTTAVMDQSPSFMLNHQTRMLLSIGVHTSPATLTTDLPFCRLHMLFLDSCHTIYLLLSTLSTESVDDLSCPLELLVYWHALHPCILEHSDHRLTIT